MSEFERAQLRLAAFGMLCGGTPRHNTLYDHPSIARAVNAVVDWLTGSRDEPFPRILTYTVQLRDYAHEDGVAPACAAVAISQWPQRATAVGEFPDALL